MGLRISVLAVLAGIVWAASSASSPVSYGCIECHSPHNETHGSCIACHRGNPRTKRLPIAHYRLIAGEYAHFNFPQSPVVASGRLLIEKLACRRCHRTWGSGNHLAADLDREYTTVQAQDLAAAIKEPAPFMPNFYFGESQISELVNAVLAADNSQSHGDETPLVIHFESKNKGRTDSFGKQCGACHRVLTPSLGGLGYGHIGPNLSGLLTRFYPQNYPAEMPWTPSGLKRWLENPRDLRAITQMPPVTLKDVEFTHILSSLGYRP